MIKKRTKNTMNKITAGIKIVKKAIQLEISCASATAPTEITKDHTLTTIVAKTVGQKIHGTSPIKFGSNNESGDVTNQII